MFLRAHIFVDVVLAHPRLDAEEKQLGNFSITRCTAFKNFVLLSCGVGDVLRQDSGSQNLRSMKNAGSAAVTSSGSGGKKKTPVCFQHVPSADELETKRLPACGPANYTYLISDPVVPAQVRES